MKPGVKVVAMAKATHFGPLCLVVLISFVLAFTQVSFGKSLLIALAILCGQCVVGWTNELVDDPLDRAAGRVKKPIVAGTVSVRDLQIGIPVALIAAILLSFFGPLGIKGGFIHMLGLGSATLYNLKLKSTWLSPLPYAISFGAMPFAIYAAVHRHPPVWLIVDFILVSVAFHFLNVIKDLEWDRDQGVLGMPQRIGKRGSAIVSTALILGAIVIVFLR